MTVSACPPTHQPSALNNVGDCVFAYRDGYGCPANDVEGVTCPPNTASSTASGLICSASSGALACAARFTPAAVSNRRTRNRADRVMKNGPRMRME